MKALSWVADALRARSAGDGVIVADLDLRILHVNAIGCAMLGYRAPELVGQRTSLLTDGKDWAADLALLTQGVDAVSSLVRYRRQNGELRPGELIVELVRNDDRTPRGVIATIVDTDPDARPSEASSAESLQTAARLARVLEGADDGL